MQQLASSSLIIFALFVAASQVVDGHFPSEDEQHHHDHHGHAHGHGHSHGPVVADGEAYIQDSSSVWLNSVSATLLVSMTSVLGIIFVVNGKEHLVSRLNMGNSFAAGAILGTCFLHILPEGLEFLEGIDEEQRGWQAGTVILCGIMTGILMNIVLGHSHEHEHTHDSSNNHSHSSHAHSHKVEKVIDDDLLEHNYNEPLLRCGQDYDDDDDTSVDDKTLVSKSLFDVKHVSSKAWSMIIGSLCHNIIDGVMIGAAFKGCGDMGWLVTGSILVHEVPAEIGHFFVLLSGGMTIKQALVFNFFTAATSLIGTIAICSMESISAINMGFLLVYGAGIFVYIGAVEILPEMLEVKSPQLKRLNVFLFVAGCVVVGLPLMFHMHCVPPAIITPEH